MNKWFGSLLIAVSLGAASCTAGAKNLVLYFSMDNVDAVTGATSSAFNTHVMADALSSYVDADEIRLDSEYEYNGTRDDIKKALVVFRKYYHNTMNPHFVNENLSLDGYDHIYIGFPIWGHDAPPEISEFLTARSDELSHSKVHLFSSSMQGAASDIFPKLYSIIHFNADTPFFEESSKDFDESEFKKALKDFADKSLNQ